MADESTQATTALTVVQRAALAIGSAEHEARLTELAKASVGITAITNAAGYQECHAARMALKKTRIEIERTGKAARDDATAFSKAVIAEERRLIGIIEPEESRLQGIQDAHDAKVAAEKAAREQAERVRVTAIRERIDELKRRPIAALRLDSAGVIAVLAELERETDGNLDLWLAQFAEFQGEAVAALDACREYLAELRDRKLAEEAEAQRLAEERAAIEAQRRADAARREAETAEQQRQAEAAAAEQRRQDAAAAAERKRLDDEARAKREAEEAEARRQREEQDRIAAEQRAEQDRIAREARQREEAAAAAARAERERIEREDRERAEAARVAEEQRLAAEREAEERTQRERDEARAAQVREAFAALSADPRIAAFVELAIAYKAAPEGTPSLEALTELAGCYAEAIGLLAGEAA